MSIIRASWTVVDPVRLSDWRILFFLLFFATSLFYFSDAVDHEVKVGVLVASQTLVEHPVQGWSARTTMSR